MRIQLSSIFVSNSNYIQIQCKLSGYIALFNFQTTAASLRLLISPQPQSPVRSGMRFNLASFQALSNSNLIFFRFFLSPTPAIGNLIPIGDVLFKLPRFHELSNPFPNFLPFFHFFNNPRPAALPTSEANGL